MAVAGALTLTPSAAQAAHQCQQGYVCIYQHWNLTGSVAVLPELSPASGHFTGQAADFRNYHYFNGTNLNDSASSVINLTGQVVWFYEHGNYNKYKSGRTHGVSPGSWSNFGEYEGLLQNDRASSANFTRP
ncbi:peptidase inhibitor family I36 protein [Micromonospora vulcania]|uniref:Peptidase inhibitor family I36 protein n=1 Tax=Micromonospora vulcania TaxID=1441873 RepID=A0ABW1H5M9_9ACTN